MRVRASSCMGASSCMPVPVSPQRASYGACTTRAYVDVGAGVGVSVGEGVGVDVGAGVGVDVGAGVGLHAQTACSMMWPLTCAHYASSRSADRPQSRRGTVRPVPARSRRGPGADVKQLSVLCVGASCLCARAWGMLAVMCVRHRTCLCMCAHEPTACL